MSVLGVVLARGGSKGLPGKHLLPLLGKPVLAYTLEHVRAAARIDHTIVSSDCPDIRALASSLGFQTIDRPAEFATDTASVQDVLLHAMGFHPRASAVVTLYGNVALRREGVIDEAIELMQRTGCDSVRSFVPVGKWHPQWMARIEGDTVTAMNTQSIHRRQDLTPLFLHDGGVVVSSRAAMDHAMQHRDDPHAFFGTDRRAVMGEQTDTVEIDSRRDLLLAEAILRDRENAR
jgi:CMP-N,N'-diacetyllegionaminic acid synthase